MNIDNHAFELDDDNVLLLDSGNGSDGDHDGDLPDVTPATDAEIKAWYQYDWAAGVIHMYALGLLMPILLQAVALNQAGFPTACDNYAADLNTSFIAAWGGGDCSTAGGYRLSSTLLESCPKAIGAVDGCFELNATAVQAFGGGLGPSGLVRAPGTYCCGPPPDPNACLDSDDAVQILRVELPTGIPVDPTTYAATAISISVLGQAAVYISAGALADRGDSRKRIMFGATAVGVVLCLLCLLVPVIWWLGMVLMVLLNVVTGLTYVMYCAYLPVLASAHTETLAVTSSANHVTYERVMSRMSARGILTSFIGHIASLAFILPVMLTIKDTATAMSIAIAGCGVWWAGFAIGPARRLKRRPGPPLTGGVWTSIRYSWRQTWDTLLKVRRLSGTAKMLALWFIYADGFSSILQTVILIVSSEIDTGCLGLQAVLAILFIEVQFVGALGCYMMERAATKFGLSDKTVVQGCLTVFVLLSVYCLFGFVSNDYGLHTAPDLFIVAAFASFTMVPIQSQSRSLFATMIPKGLESQFFALYGVTDKGSSWIGPLVLAAAKQWTGTCRYVFIWSGVLCLVGVIGLWRLDVPKARKQALIYYQEELKQLRDQRE